MKGKTGLQESIWLSNDLVDLVNDVRKELGLSKSGFYRYAVIRLLEELSVLSTKAKRNLIEKEASDIG